MRVEWRDEPWLVLHIDGEEYRTLNNSLNWACNGTNALEGEQFESHLGATEAEVRELLEFIHGASGGSGDSPKKLALTNEQIRILSRTLDVMIEGPADCLNDYELIGVSGLRFDEIHADLQRVVRELDGAWRPAEAGAVRYAALGGKTYGSLIPSGDSRSSVPRGPAT